MKEKRWVEEDGELKPTELADSEDEAGADEKAANKEEPRQQTETEEEHAQRMQDLRDQTDAEMRLPSAGGSRSQQHSIKLSMIRCVSSCLGGSALS